MIRIAVDGPAGSGKSTVSKTVAKKLGITYLDTGAMYRTAAYISLENGISGQELADKLLAVKFKFFYENEIQKLKINIDDTTVDVSDIIRTPEVTSKTSEIAAMPEVREVLTAKQKEIGRNESVIMDGRDIGTVVMPNAELKFFLVASVEERAKRRKDEWAAKGENITISQIIEDIKKRDFSDENRGVAPLKKASDAIEIDTTHLTIDEVVMIITTEVENLDIKKGPKMKIFVADYAGFCYGVERAVGMVNKTAEKYKNVCTLGPIIHNPQVVQDFAEKGVEVCSDPALVNNESTVVIRSHGITKDTFSRLGEAECNVVDATCPFVIKAQRSADRLSKSGTVIVFGEKDHPEVAGIVSYINDEYFVVSDSKEAEELPFRDKYGITAQTTQSRDNFEKIIKIVESKCHSLTVENTICNATAQRQSSAIELAGKVDMMLIIGGKNSANTTRLYHICKEICEKSYHVETVAELEKNMFKDVENVGITAGASTPGYLVNEVLEYLEEVKKDEQYQ